MRYEKLFTKLFRTPLLLESNTRAGFEAAFFDLMSGDNLKSPFQGSDRDPHAIRFDARKQAPEQGAKRAGWLMETGRGNDGRTAIIHVDGVIDKHLSAFEAACFDCTDLNDLDRTLAAAASDSSIANVLIYFNTPGGSITGVPESGAKIADLAKKKNVFAFTDGMCCSAGYWLAANCDQIYCTASAVVGSIGVYLALLDASRALETMGRKIETIKDGKLKSAGAYWKPLSDDERAHFQSWVLAIGAMFRDSVGEKRPDVSTDTMQGQGFMGRAALEAGLVDAVVADIDAAIALF